MRLWTTFLSLLRIGFNGVHGFSGKALKSRYYSQLRMLSTTGPSSGGTKVRTPPNLEYFRPATIEDMNVKMSAINWYPGHIAKAEHELREYIKKVDVVIEVRDARIPLATSHPLVPTWVGKSKPLIVVINRVDQISPAALRDWKMYFSNFPPYYDHINNCPNSNIQHSKVFFVNGKTGEGVFGLKKLALKAGITINQRRKQRGLVPRAVRAAVIGYPNVGKSAIINRLLRRKLARSFNLPGVTRSVQWVRLSDKRMEDTNPEDNIELLDSPGIIPAKQVSQTDALKLAICNDIGEASYDRVSVSAALFEILKNLHDRSPASVNSEIFKERFKIDLLSTGGEEIVDQLAEMLYKGNTISAADRILSEFRKCMIGRNALECPPVHLPSLRKLANSENLESTEDIKESSFDGGNEKDDIIDDFDETIVKKKPRPKGSLFNVDINKGSGKYDGW